MTDVTIDNFLDGKVKLRQSVKGLRATTDAVLVAAAVQAKKNDSILDVGAGNGVIGLCVGARVPIQLTALEIQENLVQLIQENAALNDEFRQRRGRRNLAGGGERGEIDRPQKNNLLYSVYHLFERDRVVYQSGPSGLLL